MKQVEVTELIEGALESLSSSKDTEENILTMRDQLLISQALYTAVKVMESTDSSHQSNLADMKALLNDKFPLWQAVEQAKENFGTLHEHSAD